ncbi:MAG: hypothetical protein FJ035_06600 [Chloroflexi bacterium]|nr:hypothetical protein [Chloroflexota bacterium]
MHLALLIVGAVTRDVFTNPAAAATERAGGAASFAARAAAALGVRAAILIVAAADADLDALEGHDLHVVPADATLAFEHDRDATGGRTLRLLARSQHVLTCDDLPAPWQEADVLLLAPLLADDVDVASFARLAAPQRALLAQGLQCRVATDGAVHTLDGPAPALFAALAPPAGARTTVFLSAEETAGWRAADRETVAARCARLVLTQGAAGARVCEGGTTYDVPPAPANAVDTTGAGDVFATALILGFSAGDAAAERVATLLAAAAVERYGAAELPTRLAPRAALEERTTDAGGAESGQR